MHPTLHSTEKYFLNILHFIRNSFILNKFYHQDLAAYLQ